MRSVTKMIASLAASAALVVSSTAAAATSSAPQAVPATAAAPSAWMALSMLSPTHTVALGGAAAAAQPTEGPPPPPPPAYATGAPVVGAEVIAFGLWAVLIGIALATSDNGGRPNSPG